MNQDIHRTHRPCYKFQIWPSICFTNRQLYTKFGVQMNTYEAFVFVSEYLMENNGVVRNFG